MLTCSWLTGSGVDGVVIRVVVLEVKEKEEEDMNCCIVVLVQFLSSFIGFEELFGIGDICF